MSVIVPREVIEKRIFSIRGRKVMIDNELVTFCHRFETMKHSMSLPCAFTEHGVAMLASVLNSEKAIKMSIIIIKTFVKLREIMETHKELANKLSEIENKIEKHDVEIQSIFEAIR